MRSDEPRPPRLVCVSTHGVTADALMRGQLAFMARRGFDVTVVASPGEHLSRVRQREGVNARGIDMDRDISLAKDLRALWQLVRFFRRSRPDIVNAGTPKAGLLGMIAAWLTRVPVRIYTLRGLRGETVKGLKGLLLSLTERIASACAHRVLCVSESLRAEYLRRGLAAETKLVVLGAGSSNGVDTARFKPREKDDEAVLRLRLGLGLPDDALVIGFVGRLTRDKGIAGLSASFFRLAADFPRAFLLIVGDVDETDAVQGDVVTALRNHPRVVVTGMVQDPAVYYNLMSVLVFPSWREGFPNAPLEAAASGVPVVGYRSTGTVDAVVDGVTGSLVATGDEPALEAAMRTYLSDPALCLARGNAGRARVESAFRSEIVWERLSELYGTLLDSAGR